MLLRRLAATLGLGLALQGGCAKLKPNSQLRAHMPVGGATTSGSAGGTTVGGEGGNAGATESSGQAGEAGESKSGGQAGSGGESGAAGASGGESGVAGASGGAPNDPLLPDGYDYYVHAETGSDRDAVGTRELPFRTITRAIAAATETGGEARIYVGAGRYDAALGEVFPLELRGGVSVIGAGAEKTVIEGTAMREMRDTSMEGVFWLTLIVGDERRASTVAELTLQSGNVTILPGRSAIFCDRGDAPYDEETSVALTTLDGIVIEPSYDRGVTVTSTIAPEWSACNLVMRDSRVSGAVWGIYAHGCRWPENSGPIFVGPEVSMQVGAGNDFLWTGSYPGSFGSAIGIEHCVTNTSIHENSFSHNYMGIFIDQLDPAHYINHFSIVANDFVGNTNAGIFLAGSSVVIDELRDNVFEENRESVLGVEEQPASGLALRGHQNLMPRVFARANQFLRNDVGVSVDGPPNLYDADGPLDFGTAEDPGRNVFQCNARKARSAYVLGADVEMRDRGSGMIPFAGNLWDSSPPDIREPPNEIDGADVLYWAPGPILDVSDAELGPHTCDSPKQR